MSDEQPTPEESPNGEVEAAEMVAVAPPPLLAFFFPTGLEADVSAHPALDGPVLNLKWDLHGDAGQIVTRFPLGIWESLKEQIDNAIKNYDALRAVQDRAAASGIQVASHGTDLSKQAEAAREAERELKEGPKSDA